MSTVTIPALSFEVLDEPLTIEQIRKQFDETEQVTGIVSVELADCGDLEGFLDTLSDKLTGTEILCDIDYTIVGASDEGGIYLRVTGDPSMILDDDYV